MKYRQAIVVDMFDLSKEVERLYGEANTHTQLCEEYCPANDSVISMYIEDDPEEIAYMPTWKSLMQLVLRTECGVKPGDTVIIEVSW